MPDSSEHSMKSMDSESNLSQSYKSISLFGRIFNLLKNGLLNELDGDVKHAAKKKNGSKIRTTRSNVRKANKITKSPKTKTMKIKNKLLAEVLKEKKNVIDLKQDNREQFNIPIRPPTLEPLKLRIAHTQNQVHNTAPHKVTYEGRKNIKPQIIQLGSRKAIRIDPNSSNSNVSLSPPAMPVQQSDLPIGQQVELESSPAVSISPPPSQPVVSMWPAIPVSPPTVSLSPPAVSVSSPLAMVSGPAFSPYQSHQLFYKTINGSQLTPMKNIDTSNTSTPFRSRSRMIRVNTVDDLDEPQNNKISIEESKSSSLQGDNNQMPDLSSIKDKKKKKKKSRDGQKRKKRRELLRNEDKTTFRLDKSNDKMASTEKEVNFNANRTFGINNIHNPFISNSPSKPKKTEDNIRNIPKHFENNKRGYDLNHNSRNEFEINNRTTDNVNLTNSNYKNIRGKHLSNDVENLNAVSKETGNISKLFTSSDINSENDKALLKYQSNSKQFLELKWPGHDSVGDIIIQNEPTTPDKWQDRVIDISEKVEISTKPRLLSEIMAEKYQRDGISFLGKFRTPHIPSESDLQSNNESRSTSEQKKESPVYKKFGIDIRKERFREGAKHNNNSNAN